MPFARIAVHVFDHMAELGPIGLAVYAGLAKYADNHTRVCFPRQSTLAELLHLPRQTVNAAILRLEACGLIEIERQAGYGHVYRLLDAEPSTGARDSARADNQKARVEPRASVEAQPTGGVSHADTMNYTDLTIPKTQQHPPAQTAPSVVVVPPCLRNLNVEPILAPLPAQDRQTVLDTYAARHDWGNRNGAPVALPAAMLRALVSRQQAGALDTTQAEKIARRREIPTSAPPSRPATRATALDALKQARAALGGRRLN